MKSALLKIEWQNRTDTLDPSSVIAFAAAAITLAEKLLLVGDESLQALKGVGAKEMILLAGSSDDLPWVNGAVYLGKDPQMPGFLLPTTLEPKLPADLFGRVMETKFKSFAPFAVLPGKVVPFGKAKNLSRGVLETWLAENR
jgi:hypothetical protein